MPNWYHDSTFRCKKSNVIINLFINKEKNDPAKQSHALMLKLEEKLRAEDINVTSRFFLGIDLPIFSSFHF